MLYHMLANALHTTHIFKITAHVFKNYTSTTTIVHNIRNINATHTSEKLKGESIYARFLNINKLLVLIGIQNQFNLCCSTKTAFVKVKLLSADPVVTLPIIVRKTIHFFLCLRLQSKLRQFNIFFNIPNKPQRFVWLFADGFCIYKKKQFASFFY